MTTQSFREHDPKHPYVLKYTGGGHGCAMSCPKCQKPMKRGSVADVRWRKGYVYRRRECGYCGHRVTTEERIVRGKQ